MGNLWVVIACLMIGLTISMYVLVPDQTSISGMEKYNNTETDANSIISGIGAKIGTAQGVVAVGATAAIFTVAVLTGSVLGAFLVLLAVALFAFNFIFFPVDVYTSQLPSELGLFILSVYNFLIVVAVIDFLKDW